MRIHELKTWPHYFKEVVTNRKLFEVRENDRDFQYGDILYLREWLKTDGYTGRECKVRVIGV